MQRRDVDVTRTENARERDVKRGVDAIPARLGASVVALASCVALAGAVGRAVGARDHRESNVVPRSVARGGQGVRR
jgi:hypothetical protein